MSELADIAVIGLAVMGQNLILNMHDKGFVVCENFSFSSSQMRHTSSCLNKVKTVYYNRSVLWGFWKSLRVPTFLEI